ncbi:hypothetical protein [Acidisphaera sp. L21]|uniref:hypothetical protein n=1 Tax=Acidisphaera sp. L21 TaxID=1641851 RepID=UPI0020B15C6D|nr:hypothetical protein [Acidisphaera sp. L21]
MTARHHVGLLIPSSNTTVEHEYNRFGPPEITWHVGRLRLTEVSAKGMAEQEPDIDREAAKLGTAHPEVIVLGQSAIGFICGESYEQTVKVRLQAASGAIPLSAAQLMVAAVDALAQGGSRWRHPSSPAWTPPSRIISRVPATRSCAPHRWA